MMNRYGNRAYGQAQQGRNQPLRPLFESNQLENYGIWLQIIPHQVKMLITQFGTGPTPKAGQFIRLKQFVYLDSMVLIKSQRITYPFGRSKALQGLEICLAMCRQGFKARCFISSSYAYGNQKAAKIPPNANLVIEVQVLGIFSQPVTKDEFDDKLLLNQIKILAKQGDQFAEKGDLLQAQLKFQQAFMHIQSTRCKEIKNYLYAPLNKQSYHRNNEEFTSNKHKIQKDKTQLVSIFKVFDIIKIKTVEIALLNKDYYKVIILSKQCLMESRLELNQRILAARARAFAQVGEFQIAIDLMRHLSDKYKENAAFKEQLARIEAKKEMFERRTNIKMDIRPVLSFKTNEQTLIQKDKLFAKMELRRSLRWKEQQQNQSVL